MRRELALAIAFLTILTLTPAALAGDDEEPSAEVTLSRIGRATYRVYCANCHGDRGTGDGVVAEVLKVPPTDLTTLNDDDDEFPMLRVMRVIDGRKKTRGHGSREMPVWGEAFRPDGGSDAVAEAAVEAKVRALATYIRSIQVER